MDASQINDSLIEQTIKVRGRVQNIRNKGKFCFLILRDGLHSIQCIVNNNEIPENDFNVITHITLESLIIVTGILVKSLVEIKSCSFKNLEIKTSNISVINKAEINGFQVNCDHIDSNENTKYDLRFLDLRNKENQIIFRIKSDICRYTQEFLFDNDFVQIQTPKIISSASEGGSNVFELKYFDKKAYLAQSPQLFKQMTINGEFEKVFEIGPVFRAEKSHSNRHLTEFTGIDIEMRIKNHYHEVVKILWNMLKFILSKITIKYDISLEINDLLIIEHKQAINYLREEGIAIGDHDDLNSVQEKKLGEIVKNKFDSDLFVLDKFPLSVRPFYTLSEDGIYSNSYDFILRGMEILSGAQRINNYDELIKRSQECNVDISKIKHYLDSFKYGTYPHGGGGFGLERMIINILNLDNVRKGSLFYRDPDRLEP